MLWYGAYNSKNSIKYFKYKNKSTQNLLIKNKITTKYVFDKKNHDINYLLPSSWNLIIIHNQVFKNTYFIFYSKIYFLKTLFLLPTNVLYFDIITKQLYVNTLYVNNYVIAYTSLLHTFFTKIIKPPFKKIKFKGKGYYIYKNFRNTITPQFGYSHRLYLYSFYVNVKFLNKTTLICFGINQSNVNFISEKIFYWRPINIFTGRGVRFSKQIIYKKSGKVSSYR
jgi:hypothetical protein